MEKKEHKHSVHYRIRSYEVDHLQEATISTICNYFQEAAGLHAHELQFDISDLQEKGLTWILYKLQVTVHEFPRRWDRIRVTTWPSTGDGLRAYRDYELYNHDGKLLATGLSQWIVLNINRKRPVKIPEKLMSKHFKTDKHVLELHKENLPKINGENANLITTANLNDLDMNKHVNNVRYIDWLTGYHLSGHLRGKKCREIIVQYTSQTQAGDKIYLSTEASSGNSNEISSTLFKNGNHVIANATTGWA